MKHAVTSHVSEVKILLEGLLGRRLQKAEERVPVCEFDAKPAEGIQLVEQEDKNSRKYEPVKRVGEGDERGRATGRLKK